MPNPRPDVWICEPCGRVFMGKAAPRSSGHSPMRSRLRRAARYSLALLGAVLLLVVLVLLAFRIAAWFRESSGRAEAAPPATRTPVLWGEDDTVSPLAQGEDLARLIPGARLVVLPQTGHIPAVEGVTRFNHALPAFLNEHRMP